MSQRGVEQSVARRAHHPEAAGSSPAPATIEKAPILGLFPFLHCAHFGDFCNFTTKIRHFEIAVLDRIELPACFFDEYANWP